MEFNKLGGTVLTYNHLVIVWCSCTPAACTQVNQEPMPMVMMVVDGGDGIVVLRHLKAKVHGHRTIQSVQFRVTKLCMENRSLSLPS